MRLSASCGCRDGRGPPFGSAKRLASCGLVDGAGAFTEAPASGRTPSVTPQSSSVRSSMASRSATAGIGAGGRTVGGHRRRRQRRASQSPPSCHQSHRRRRPALAPARRLTKRLAAPGPAESRCLRTGSELDFSWWRGRDLNPRPSGYERGVPHLRLPASTGGYRHSAAETRPRRSCSTLLSRGCPWGRSCPIVAADDRSRWSADTWALGKLQAPKARHPLCGQR
jgi:hypothetical protein